MYYFSSDCLLWNLQNRHSHHMVDEKRQKPELAFNQKDFIDWIRKNQLDHLIQHPLQHRLQTILLRMV